MTKNIRLCVILPNSIQYVKSCFSPYLAEIFLNFYSQIQFEFDKMIQKISFRMTYNSMNLKTFQKMKRTFEKIRRIVLKCLNYIINIIQTKLLIYSLKVVILLYNLKFYHVGFFDYSNRYSEVSLIRANWHSSGYSKQYLLLQMLILISSRLISIRLYCKYSVNFTSLRSPLFLINIYNQKFSIWSCMYKKKNFLTDIFEKKLEST